jgi:DNA helicase II / ATP-dependent DNA helicase PcrA
MLNEVQQRIALHNQGPLLVIAGAGTGKTRTLTHRFATLVDTGIAPERILLLTFSRKAAGEMQDRATELLINKGISCDLARTGGTFHSTAFRWLRQLGKVESGFDIVDDKDLKKLVKMSLKTDEQSELTAAGISLNDLLQIRSLSVNLQQNTRQVITRFFPHALLYSPIVETLLNRLEKQKEKSGMLNFDDILLKWLLLLRSKQGDIIRSAYDTIMVDEYQDTSRIQVDILQELAKTHHNIMAVGDDCQSIYSFRGALADQMHDFEKDFPGAKTVKLENNYRSSQEILDICNDVIAESKDVIPKELQSAEHKKGPQPLLVEGNNEDDVALRILQKVLDNLSSGIPLEQQAVLFRSSMQAMSLEKNIIKQGIPYKKFGGLKMTEAAHLRDFMSIISCCFCKNSAAWLRVLGMLPGVGTVTAAKALNAVDNNVIGDFTFPAKCTDLADELLAFVLSQPDDNPQPQFIHGCLNWYKVYLYEQYDNASSRLYDLENLCAQLLMSDSLSEFAAEILLDHVEAQESEYESQLVLSTIHSAKGKEWDAVFILNVADGSLPLHRPSIDFEEERRLLYVAMTRARQQLSLYWPLMSRTSYGQNSLSPFLKILDKDEKKEEYNPYSLPEDKNDDNSDELIYVYTDLDF